VAGLAGARISLALEEGDDPALSMARKLASFAMERHFTLGNPSVA
jgi:hypothetical protein